MRGLNMERTSLIIIIYIVLFISCSLDYKGAVESEDLADKVPNIVFYNFTHTAVDNDKIVFRIEADVAKVFENKNVIILQGIHFQEFSKEDGQVITTGKADYALFHRDTENAEISGSIYFYSATEEATLYAQSLSWQKDKKLLAADPQDLVIIKRDNGSFIQGRMFSADLRRMYVSFLEQVQGKYTEVANENE